MCEFDVSQPGESRALRATVNAESCPSRIGYFGAAAEGAYALTATETMSLFEMGSAQRVASWGNDLVRGTGLRQTLGVDYLVDCVYEPRGQRLVLLGGTNDGALEGFLVRPAGFDRLGPLRGADPASGHVDVVRCADAFDGGRGVGWAVVTGGEDGRIVVWSAAAPA